MAEPIITLTTDFGLTDSYVAEMKGVILSINPNARIVDLVHELKPHDVVGAALFLERTCPHFPDGTIHLACVDPGVGTSRRAICVRTARNVYVAPDNGLVTLAIENETPWKAITLTNTKYHYGDKTSSTFHGRDIFAPVAAHISTGVEIGELGEPAGDVETVVMPGVRKLQSGVLEGRIVHIDRFGNMISNVTRKDVTSDAGSVTVEIAGIRIRGLSETYGDKPAGEMLALWGSGDHLEISLNQGSAEQRLGTGVGSRIGIRTG